MADVPFGYLYRASSDQTVGTNNLTRFAPQLPPGQSSKQKFGLRYEMSEGTLATQLHRAIIGHKTEANPLIFFTTSLLCAILHAYKKYKAGETGANIVCFCATAVQSDGNGSATFRPLLAVRKDLGMKKVDAQRTKLPLDYADVFVTSNTVVLPQDARRTYLDDLESAGLYEIFPELGIISRRSIPGLATPTADLRALWYQGKDGEAKDWTDLAPERFIILARVAMTFKTVTLANPETEEVPLHILVSFLSLKGQDPEGVNFKRFRRVHGITTVGTNTLSPSPPVQAVLYPDIEAVPELQLFSQIYAKLQGVYISASGIRDALPTLTLASMHEDIMELEREAYKEFKRRKREKESRRKEEAAAAAAGKKLALKRTFDEGPGADSTEESSSEEQEELFVSHRHV